MSDEILTARELAGEVTISVGAPLFWVRAGQAPSLQLPSGATWQEKGPRRLATDDSQAWDDAIASLVTGAGGPSQRSRGRDRPEVAVRDQTESSDAPA
jgi:hypothetical protein